MPPEQLTDTIHTFERWLHLPDPGALLTVLATVAANRMDGDPVWVLLVGPPGGGKTELLSALNKLEDTHPAATLTEASLLSGTSNRERAIGAKGGLLRSIGDFGIILAKDFGSVLSMNRDARALLLAALREIYDGSWTRHVGTDGGRTLSWTGKVGFVGGCTPTIDRHHAVMGAMGERFLFYRLPSIDDEQQARRALTHAGHEKRMRLELSESAAHALNGSVDTNPPEPSPDEVDTLVQLATLVARARSAVERDGYSRDIELIPPPEAPTRLIVMLARLLQGLAAIGLERQQAFELVTKIAFDSMPTLRRRILDELHGTDGQLDTQELSQRTDYPNITTRRALEDLTAHKLVERHAQGEGRAHQWCLTGFARSRLDLFPNLDRNVVVRGNEKQIERESALQTSLLPIHPDISVEVPEPVSVGSPTVSQSPLIEDEFPF